MSPRQVARAMGVFGAAALAVVFVVTVWVVRHHSVASGLRQAIGMAPESLVHARNFEWTQMKGGTSQWHLRARDASYSKDKTSIVLSDARLSMIARDGKPVEVSAPHAEIAVAGSHIKAAHLSGGLAIRYGDFLMQTGEATFKPDEDIVNAPGEVRITGQGLTVTGVGLNGHLKDQTFSLLKQTDTVVVLKKNSDGKSHSS
jgi:LPS export ABC transporter protein LptC